MIFAFAEIVLHPSGGGPSQCRLKKRYLNIDKVVEVRQHDSQTSILNLDDDNIKHFLGYPYTILLISSFYPA